jgi:hypothetical protein
MLLCLLFILLTFFLIFLIGLDFGIISSSKINNSLKGWICLSGGYSEFIVLSIFFIFFLFLFFTILWLLNPKVQRISSGMEDHVLFVKEKVLVISLKVFFIICFIFIFFFFFFFFFFIVKIEIFFLQIYKPNLIITFVFMK